MKSNYDALHKNSLNRSPHKFIRLRTLVLGLFLKAKDLQNIFLRI